MDEQNRAVSTALSQRPFLYWFPTIPLAFGDAPHYGREVVDYNEVNAVEVRLQFALAESPTKVDHFPVQRVSAKELEKIWFNVPITPILDRCNPLLHCLDWHFAVDIEYPTRAWCSEPK